MLESQCAFFDNMAARWTDIQKEILFEKLGGLTQDEIASKLGKSQSTVSQSLKAAGFDALKKFLDNYASLFEYPDIFSMGNK
jgi:transcriptional regulator with XRE-family HTH domain